MPLLGIVVALTARASWGDRVAFCVHRDGRRRGRDVGPWVAFNASRFNLLVAASAPTHWRSSPEPRAPLPEGVSAALFLSPPRRRAGTPARRCRADGMSTSTVERQGTLIFCHRFVGQRSIRFAGDRGEFFRTVDLTPGRKSAALPAPRGRQRRRALPHSRGDARRVHASGGGEDALFGARHYRDYHFLLTLSDHVAHFGLEHHESSDDRTGEDFLTDAEARATRRRPAAARDGPFLERKTPAAGGHATAGLPAADGGRTALGL